MMVSMAMFFAMVVSMAMFFAMVVPMSMTMTFVVSFVMMFFAITFMECHMQRKVYITQRRYNQNTGMKTLYLKKGGN